MFSLAAAFLCQSNPCLAAPATGDKELVVDAVLASVDGKPVTLSDIIQVINRPIQLKDVSLDLEARRVVDGLIMEKLVEAEAENRKLKVSDDEISLYLDEVAERNKLTRKQFEEELVKQVGDLERYKRQVKLEILRQKISGQLLHTAPSVNSKDIERYIADHPELSRQGARVALRQIFFSSAARSSDENEKRLHEVLDSLGQGAKFSELASKYSDSEDARDGGSLGVVLENDLGPAVFDAVLSLKAGETSAPVSTPDGQRLFFVEDRFSEGEVSEEAIRAEVQKILEAHKKDSQIGHFFSQGIFKQHVVDKKF